jgi:osmoprotectant transport system ATP-binding protein
VTIPLSARNVTHRYGRSLALNDVSIDVAGGSTVALVGQSGSGKTTLLRCFNRLVDPDAGDVLVDGANVRAAEPIALRRRLGYVQQRGGLLPHWTVAQNVALVLRANGQADRLQRESAQQALTLVGLDYETYGRRFPHQLSGGQQQRVALARALAAAPHALLLDEPFGALDAISRTEVQDSFRSVKVKLHLTTILVTHDIAEAARLADEIVVMRDGKVEQRGTFATLKSAPATPYVRDLLTSAVSAAKELLL